MEQIAEHLYRIEGLRVANVYVIVSDDGLTLVDGGTAADTSTIVGEIEQAGHDPAALARILVTHAHADHIGSVAALAERYDADVIAHRTEAPYLEGTASMPARGVLQTLMRWMGDLLPGGDAGVDVDIRVEDGETLDVLDGLQVIHTPGHTPGSMVLYQPERKILFCGDLLFNGHPFTGRGGLQYAPRAFSVDPDQVKASAQKLADLEIRLLCPGHGAPIRREPGVKMASLLREARA